MLKNFQFKICARYGKQHKRCGAQGVHPEVLNLIPGLPCALEIRQAVWSPVRSDGEGNPGYSDNEQDKQVTCNTQVYYRLVSRRAKN